MEAAIVIIDIEKSVCADGCKNRCISGRGSSAITNTFGYTDDISWILSAQLLMQQAQNVNLFLLEKFSIPLFRTFPLLCRNRQQTRL